MNELNLNQSQFAVKCGMSISMTSKIARGERIPSVSTLQKISDTCEVKLSEFIRAAE